MEQEEEVWADVEPIFNSEADNAVVPISYSPQFALAFGRLRALLRTGEVSERALELTTECSTLNPANYTVWQYRRRLLSELKKDIGEELKFVTYVIEDNSKNYQVWHHRRCMCELLKQGADEKAFTARILNDDSKNYHAWQHRQWAVEEMGLWEGEVEWVEELLKADIRNNSAWNYRYFLFTTQPSPNLGQAEVLASEVAFAQEAIAKAPHNESAWNYLSGVLMESKGSLLKAEARAWATALYENGCRANHLMVFLIDCLRSDGEKGSGEPNNATRINAMVETLVETDPVRRNYWATLKAQ